MEIHVKIPLNFIFYFIFWF